MLLSGAANTLLMKFQVRAEAPEELGGPAKPFDHPLVQTFLMMLGELLCLPVLFALVLWRRRSRAQNNSTTESSATEVSDDLRFPPLSQQALFLLPVLCDMFATTLVNSAYMVLPASVVQMSRGAVVLFTCLFTVLFLGEEKRRNIHLFPHWTGVGLVAAGIGLVALSQTSSAESAATKGTSSALLVHAHVMGIGLCVGAQAFQAAMLVIEERLIHGSSTAAVKPHPLLAIGLEGLFGALILSLVIPVACHFGQESVSGAVHQALAGPPGLLASILASIVSIALFNVSGITVTREASAVARSTVDCSRTILVWAWELAWGWALFSRLQLGGFVLLALGTLMYNEVVTFETVKNRAPEWARKFPGAAHRILWALHLAKNGPSASTGVRVAQTVARQTHAGTDRRTERRTDYGSTR